MDQHIRACIFDTFKDCYHFMEKPLTNYAVFTKELSKRIKVKENENEQFSFDVELDNRIKDSLAAHGVTGQVFSEESGTYDLPGERRYRVVYDPFCNSSLATRTFREGALGISFFNYDYQFITAAVLDFQTGLMALVEDDKTHFYQVQTGEEITLEPSQITALTDAWAVLTLENTTERAHIAEADTLLRTAKRVIITSGHMYWLKLAAGFIDAYADPYGGEELYEMFACAIAQKAGCVVTDKQGVPFDPATYLKQFEQDRHFVYYPVAASTPALHTQLLAALLPDSKQ